MNRAQICLIWGVLGCSTVLVGDAFAIEEQFSVDAKIEARQVDNANLARDEQNAIDELQAITGVSFKGELQSSWLNFQADASVLNRYHEEIEARNENVYLGRASLSGRSDASPFFFSLEHSAEEISVDPELGDTPLNRDSRAISQGDVGVRFRFSSATSLDLAVNATSVRYDDTDENNSERMGGTATLTRAVSPILTAGVMIESQKVEFELNGDESDFRRIGVFGQWQLRRTEYSLSLGQNQYSSEGQEDSTSVYVRGEISSRFGAQDFNLNVAQWLSDTSLGDGNSQGFEDLVGQDGRIGEVDQYVIQEAALQWTLANLCMGCDLALGAQFHTESYDRLTQFDTEEFGVSANYRYQASRYWALSLGMARSSVDFENGGFNAYAETRSTFRLERTSLKRLMFALFFENIKRAFDGSDDQYSTSFVGVEARFQLYSR